MGNPLIDAIITPTVIDHWGPEAPPFRHVVYDKTGASIAIEPLDGRLVVDMTAQVKEGTRRRRRPIGVG